MSATLPTDSSQPHDTINRNHLSPPPNSGIVGALGVTDQWTIISQIFTHSLWRWAWGAGGENEGKSHLQYTLSEIWHGTFRDAQKP